MQVTVLGGGGFIGSHLTRRLLSEGYKVTVVDITDEKLGDTVQSDRITFHEADITDPENEELIIDIVAASDLVVDLIAYANPQNYLDIPLDVVDLNLFENLKIVEYCVNAGVRLIQFSTCEVYGKIGERSDHVLQEDRSDLVLGPVGKQRWIYSCAKQLLERMVYAHGTENSLAYTIVRPFNFVGPKMDYLVESPDEGTPRVFAAFMSALLFNHPMQLVNGGQHRRTFTYIDDAIDAVMMLVENPDDRFTDEVVNIGTPSNETTIHDLAVLMRDIYSELSPDGELPPLQTVDGEEFYGDGYEDSERRVPDISKLTGAGWSPSHDLRATFESSIAYYIEHYERG